LPIEKKQSPKSMPNRQSAIGNRQLLAWQGVELTIASEWSPLKIEGDFDRGFVALADLDRQRLGVRWQSVRKKPDTAALKRLVADAMKREVGQLAFDESTESSSDEWPVSRLYIEPDPPGRDVWIGYSPHSQRVVELAYQAERREPTLADMLVPSVRDKGQGQGALEWSVFWHNVVLPSPMKLAGQRLNVGDLSLTFATEQGDLIVRQMAAAKLALSRRSLEGWLRLLAEPKRHRAVGEAEEVSIEAGGATCTGLRQRHVRRRRFFWMRWIPSGFVTYVLRDEQHDRLILLRAPDESLGSAVAAGVGRVEVE
jgi:hypothetical protein